MQRTVYDVELPAGTRKRDRDRLLDAVEAAHPGADVQLVESRSKGAPTRYRIVAQLPKPRGGRR